MESSEPDNALLPRKRAMVFIALFVLLSAVGLYAVYDRFADGEISFDMRLLSPSLVLSITLLLSVYFIADGLRLYYTLRALGYRLPTPHMLRLVFINIFFANVTPLATGGGLAQIWYLQHHGVPVGSATAATTIRTALSILLIFSAAPVFLLMSDNIDHHILGNGTRIYLALFITIYLGFFAVVLLRARWLLPPLLAVLAGLRRLRLVGRRRYRRWRFKIKRELLRFSHSFALYLAGPKKYLFLSLLFTLIFLLALFSFPALLIAGLGYQVDYVTVVGLLVITTFIMYFSPTPGASGVAEGVFGHFFMPLLGPSHLVLVTFVWRFLTIYLGMAVGLAVTHREVSGGEVRHVAT